MTYVIESRSVVADKLDISSDSSSTLMLLLAAGMLKNECPINNVMSPTIANATVEGLSASLRKSCQAIEQLYHVYL